MQVSLSELILSLPAVLSCDILSVWLSIPDLVGLDSAYCHHNYRQRFRRLCEQLELVGSSSYNFKKSIRWFIDRRIRLQDFSACVELPTDLVVGYLKEFGRAVESISVSGNANSEMIEAVRVHCPNAKSLAVHEVVGLALALLNTLQRVDSLKVYFTNYGGENNLPTSQLDDLPNLRKLKITWEYVQMEDIISLVDKCTHLTHFSPHCCDSIDSKGVINLFSNLSHLIALDANSLSVDDALLAAIAVKCPQLEHLDVHHCRTITDAGLHSIATTLKLKSISIPGDFELTDKSLQHLHHCCDTLQVLHISHWVCDEGKPVHFSRSAVLTLLQSCQNTCQFTWSAYLLEHIQNMDVATNATSLSVCTTLTDALLLGIAQHCKYLETLDIYSETGSTDLAITSAGLEAVINYCCALKQICVHRKMNRTPYADVMAMHSNLFIVGRVSEYDIMTM